MSDQVIPTIYPENPPPATAPAAQVAPAVDVAPVVRGPDFIARGKDARGRTIGIRKMNMGMKFAMVRALSAESASKGMLYYWSGLACAVCEIDGEHIPTPQSELAIQAMVQRLDEDGLNCVGKLQDDYFPPLQIDAAKN